MPVALALFSGLSRADLRTITWKEVDLAAGLICRPRHKPGSYRMKELKAKRKTQDKEPKAA